MLNSCKNSIKILKIACKDVGTVANEGITKNALLDQKLMYFFMRVVCNEMDPLRH